ncbi:MAG: hypothetical protein MUF58_20910 [Arcicella sp.]|jgi:hypothetical protein|nr:hypothetical protein [Arcicella sp.]
MRKGDIKIILTAIVLFTITILSCKMDKKATTKALSNQKFDSVIVYIYDGFTGQSIIDSNNNLDSTIVSHYKLNSLQENELMTLISKKRTIKNDSLNFEEAACCSPHHGIVFYKNHKPDKWISLCFDCNCIVSTIVTDVRPAHLVDFFSKLHLKIGMKELIPKHFGIFDANDDIRKINRQKYGKTYDSLRHNL